MQADLCNTHSVWCPSHALIIILHLCQLLGISSVKIAFEVGNNTEGLACKTMQAASYSDSEGVYLVHISMLFWHVLLRTYAHTCPSTVSRHYSAETKMNQLVN